MAIASRLIHFPAAIFFKERAVLKNILAIIGSLRKLGNCEIMAKEISRRIDEPHELRLLRLSEYEIRSCRGCYNCLRNQGLDRA